MTAAAQVLGNALGLILLTAAVAKALSPTDSAAAIAHYAVARKGLAKPTVGLQILLEAGLGIALVAGGSPTIAMAGAGLLFLLFAGVMSRALRSGHRGQCGCLGKVLPITMDWYVVATNCVLGVLALSLSQTGLLEAPPAASRGLTFLSGSTLTMVYWLAAYGRSVARTVEDHLERVTA